jgi:ATP-dependent exoDNAse (exonuclease V) beta subunit
LDDWVAYRDVVRLGRKTRIPEPQRKVLWSTFERVRAGLKARQLITHAQLFSSLATAISKNKNVLFDFAVVDEAQDISVAHVRFFAALGGGRPNALFFAGDLGQRIFQQPFSWKALGVDIRGRSRTLRVNYRTSHQIRTQADRLLGPMVTDVDGNGEDRTQSSPFRCSIRSSGPSRRNGIGSPRPKRLAILSAAWPGSTIGLCTNVQIARRACVDM